MENLSRGKKMLAILNKNLKERFAIQNKPKRKNYDDLDVDYKPESESDSDSQVINLLPVTSQQETYSHEERSLHPVSSREDIPSQKEALVGLDLGREAAKTPFEEENSPLSISFQEVLQGDNSLQVVSKVIQLIIDLTMLEVSKKFTKEGTLRKRKKVDTPLSERIAAKKIKKISKHTVKPSCSAARSCFLECNSKFSLERRKVINQQYWESTKDIQQNFLLTHVKRVPIKRTVVVSAEPLRKLTSFHYFLKDDTGDCQRVCKTFFLGTLGYDSHDDRFLRTITSSENEGTAIYKHKHQTRVTPNKKFDRTIIVDHINSFGPTISHYRREHAPNRRYLPSDINIAYMHKHFQDRNPTMKVSYQVYRQVVAEQNISFVKLGHEECWACEVFDLHCKQIGHEKENLQDECDICQKWTTHKQREKLSREAYQKDGESNNSDLTHLVVSADLQKRRLICCAHCMTDIAYQCDVFPMSKDGVQSNYCNPNGYVFETVTVSKATNVELIGRPSTQFSWFPGYSWTIVQCKVCSSHLGWKFSSANLKPDKFFGLAKSGFDVKIARDTSASSLT